MNPRREIPQRNRRGARHLGFPPRLSRPSSWLGKLLGEPAASSLRSCFSLRGAAVPFLSLNPKCGTGKAAPSTPTREGTELEGLGLGDPFLTTVPPLLPFLRAHHPALDPSFPSPAEALPQPGRIQAPSPTYLPSSSKSWYSSVKRLQVMVAIPGGWRLSLPVRSWGQAALLSLPPSPCAPGALSSPR